LRGRRRPGRVRILAWGIATGLGLIAGAYAFTMRRITQRERVAGKADTQPLVPDDPYILANIAANRRVTITLIREEAAHAGGTHPDDCR